jgi:CheY-like chemotaxis protein
VALENSRLYQETRRAYEELSDTQDQLTQARKMEAVGRLAGGVAHDFNNLLTVMIGRSQLLLRRLGAQDPLRPEIELMGQTADRAADLTRQLLAFSRKQVLQPTVLDLNTVLSTLGNMLKRLIGEDIALATALDPALGRAKVDASQIAQIVMNLAANARDAMPEGGRLTLETANVDLDVAYARRHVGVHPGPHTVYGVVKQSEGHIWVYSEPGQGTTFKIYFPRVDEAVDPVAVDSDLPALGHGHETILVVEDEPAVLDLARDVLRAHGYTLLEARDGREALRLSEQYTGPIHLMLTDVVMPHMSGRELAGRIAPSRPTMPVIYMSGYTDNAVVHHGVLDSGTAFLQKPFTPEALLRKVGHVLGAAGDRQPPAEALSVED